MKLSISYIRKFFYFSSLLISTLCFSQQSFSIDELIGNKLPEDIKNNYNLRNEVYEAFSKMQEAAKLDGIEIIIASGYRSAQRQLSIWNRKYDRFQKQGLSDLACVNKIMEYSTLPGTSRHHWGTDLDLVMKVDKNPKSLLMTENYEKGGVFHPLKIWMDTHASKFGFKLVYTNIPNRKGFSYEPWHYTYAPTSEAMMEAYIKENCILKIDLDKIKGCHEITPEKLITYYNENIIILNLK